MEEDKNKRKMHPNSLKHLKPGWTSETGKQAQLLGAAKKKANSQARKALKMSVIDWKSYKTDILDEHDISSIDVLKILMMQALDREEYDVAADLAKSLAEFEKPKLARIDSVKTEVSVDSLSDDELNAKIQELGLRSD